MKANINLSQTLVPTVQKFTFPLDENNTIAHLEIISSIHQTFIETWLIRKIVKCSLVIVLQGALRHQSIFGQVVFAHFNIASMGRFPQLHVQLQHELCASASPICWEASTQWGTPYLTNVTSPEGGAERACNKLG